MKLWRVVIMVIAIACSAVAQPEIEPSFEAVVESCGSLLPAEEALTQIVAILADYCWAFCGYLMAWVPMVLRASGYFCISISSMMGLVGSWLQMIGNSCSSLLLTGWVWGLFAVCGSLLSGELCADFGRMLIEIADSTKSLGYFFQIENEGAKDEKVGQ